MKKTLAMLLAIMMLCALMAGCGQSNQPAASPAASEAAAENNGASEEAASFKVGFIVSDASSGFWKEVLESFEKACDDYLTEYVKEAKYKTLTPEPVAAYILAKETEAKCVRIIMTCKLHNIDAETIKERVREAYV